jgi:hypothetical protein
MEIDTKALADYAGYTKSATAYLVEYGFVSKTDGMSLVAAVHTIQRILKNLDQKIQTNDLERKNDAAFMVDFFKQVQW